MTMKGILIDTDFDIQLSTKRNGAGLIINGFLIGENTDQCAAIALSMQQGELKEDPLLGAGLTRFIRGKYSQSQIDQRIRQHLTRAGVNYQDYKHRIQTMINTSEL